MRIFLVGGGTGGPITPLFAVAEEILKLSPKSTLYFVGTKKKVENKILEASRLSIQYLSILAGKWRRYFSLWNLTDLFKIFAGFLKSIYLIKKHKPDVIFGAGSYVQVPMAWAAFFAGVPVVAHQPDLDLLLSTRLVSPIATAITVTFDTSTKDFSEFSGLFKKIKKSKIVVTGNPVRQEILKGSLGQARKIFGLNADFPVLFVIGGSTGAANLNKIVLASLQELVKYVQVLHVTGGRVANQNLFEHPHYHAYDFLGQELKHAFAAADVVLSRGGMSTISELAALGKAAILVPLPRSPQEDNVRLLATLRAAVGVFEEFFTPDLLVALVRKILWSKEIQDTVRTNIKKLMPRDSGAQIAKLLLKTAQTNENAS